MLHSLNRRGAHWIASHRQNRIVAGGARIAQAYCDAWANRNFNEATNGERRVLSRLADVRVIFDVGAHRGEWARQARRLHSDAVVHCFEPNPTMVNAINDRLGDDDHVIINPFALGASETRMTLYVDDARPDMGSLVESRNRSLTEIETPVRTGASYIAAAGLNDVDLLKVDAEGYDLEVLRGFGDELTKVRVIQFEYSRWNIRSRTLLSDFYDLLEPFGFSLGKIRPNTVEFKDYTDREEDFIGPAVIATRDPVQLR